MKVRVVDLGSQWTHRIMRVFKYLGADASIVSVDTPLEKLDADALVLSGGAVRISLGETDLGNTEKFLDDFHGPILGMCAGQQLMGLHFGGKVRAAEEAEYGKVELIVDDHDDLFEGLPDKFTVWASHNDELESEPGFKILAHSKDVRNHAMKHEKRPLYACLFHPEVEHTEHGSDIFANFLKQAKV